MLEALYFIAQIVAAAAIVGSLVFVGFQIRAQTREQAIQRMNERAGLTGTLNSYIIQNAHVTEAIEKANRSGLSALNNQEFNTYMAVVRQSMLMSQTTHAQIKAGQIAADAKSPKGTVTRFLLSPAFQEWWAFFRVDYSPDFVDYIDGLIAWGQKTGITAMPGREYTYVGGGVVESD